MAASTDARPAAGPGADRFVPTVGFVVAGFGLASGFLPWTDAVAFGPVGSVPGVVAALFAFVAFGTRRYGMGDRSFAIAAGLGSGVLMSVAAVAFLYPVAAGGTEPPIGIGIPIAFVLGVLGVGIAYADYRELPRDAFLERARTGASALGIGLVGLLVAELVALVFASVIPQTDTMVRSGVLTVGFSIGLGLVALGFLALTDNDLSFIDLRWPSRRDWAYVVVGVIAMYVVLIVMGLLTTAIGLPSSQHGLIENARDNPAMLLIFIPLSWVAIGPGEELLNRNIIQKYLYDAYSRHAAVLVATMVFTIIHLPAYATGSGVAIFTTLVRLFAISLVLGVVYERTENVVASALVHGTYDAIQFGLAYVALTAGLL